MDQVQVLAQIRSFIRHKFARFSGSTDVVPSEAMLIRDGYFCGRRFSGGGYEAVWFIEENQIKFYDREGSLLESLSVTPEALRTTDASRKAA